MSEEVNNHQGETGHEEDVVKVGGITGFMVVLTVAVVFIGWLIVAVLNSFEGRERQAELESRPSPFAAERSKLPPEPRLQLAPNSEEQIDKNEAPDLKTQHPLEEMKALRATWKNDLDHYGWVDKQSGVVRIPIEQAKKMLLERGLPTRGAKKAESAQSATATQQ